jgi:hypothetical protein
MTTETVKCEVCGKMFSRIVPSHLQQHGLTTTDYKRLYPGAPFLTQTALLETAERNRRNNQKRVGIPRDQSIKDKVSATKKQKYADGETVAWNKGVRRTEEEKQHQSQVVKQQYANGRVHHMKGKHHNDDVKRKIAETALKQNRTFSEESKRKRELTLVNKRAQGWEKNRKTKYMAEGERYLSEDKQWLEHQHITLKKPIYQIADEIGLDRTTISDRFARFGIKVHSRFSTSKPEREIATFLEESGIATICNTKKIITPFELDVYLPEYKIAIEHCGLYWHSTKYKDKLYHKQKMEACKQAGVRLITMFEDEWQFRKDIVKDKLLQLVGKGNREVIYGRKTTVDTNISTKEKDVFFDKYHIQGTGPGSITIGLRDENGALVAAGTFVISGRKGILNRYATARSVPGGFTKVVKHFWTTQPTVEVLESFSDLRWSEGDLYRTNGWKEGQTIAADYYWVKGLHREHKFNFRHARLKTRLEHYDPTQTEVENCTRHGWLQLYDCGKTKWILEKK